MNKLFLVTCFSFFTAFNIFADPLAFADFSEKYRESANLYYQKKFEQALELLDIIAKDSYADNYPSVFLSRAMTLYFLHKYELARNDIEKCILLQPYSLKPILCRSIISTAQKDYKTALADINYCLDKNSSWAEAYHQKGLICLNMSNYSDALTNFNEAILNNSGNNNPEFFSDRGFAYYYLEEFKKAKEDFLYALKYAENDDVYLCLIDICYKEKEFDEGIKYADILIKKESRINSAIIERSYIYLVQNRFDEVKKDLDAIEKTSNELSSYHKIKGIYYILTDDMESCISEINKAYELNKNDKDILMLRSLVKNKSINNYDILDKIKTML